MRPVAAFLLSTVAVFAPIQPVLTVALVLTLADLVLGVWGAMKRSEPITSKQLRRTLVKLFVYEVGIALGFLGEHYLLGGSVPVVKLAAGLVGLFELKSIFENLDQIYGGGLFKTILEKLNGSGKE